MYKHARPSYTNESVTVAFARIAFSVMLVIAMVWGVVHVMKDTADKLHDKTVEFNQSETP